MLGTRQERWGARGLRDSCSRWNIIGQQLLLAELEHLPYGGDRRGYFAARVTEKQLEVDLRFVTSVEEPNGSGYHERTFVVESGNSGAPGS